MFKHCMEIVHYHYHCNGYLDWLFHQNVFPMKELTSKTFSKFSGWTFNMFLLLNCILVYFIYF